jgi:hypothetical protein
MNRNSNILRGTIVGLGAASALALGLVWSSDTPSPHNNVQAVTCSSLPAGMPKHSVVTDPGGHGAACDQSTSPAVKRCATSIGGSFAVGLGFGGPVGALAGAAGAAVGCGASTLN